VSSNSTHLPVHPHALAELALLRHRLPCHSAAVRSLLAQHLGTSTPPHDGGTSPIAVSQQCPEMSDGSTGGGGGGGARGPRVLIAAAPREPILTHRLELSLQSGVRDLERRSQLLLQRHRTHPPSTLVPRGRRQQQPLSPPPHAFPTRGLLHQRLAADHQPVHAALQLLRLLRPPAELGVELRHPA
jgi:hypothetical protein